MADTLFLALTIWAVTGVYCVVRTGSRGIGPDILFGILWPVYWYTDWRNGLWTATWRGTFVLLLPAIVVAGVALFAGLL